MLEKLLGGEKAHDKIYLLPVGNILPNPSQPRRTFDEDAMRELSMSIEQYGVLQPISVRRIAKDRYELISGERRLRATKLAGLKEIPSIITETDGENSAIMALIENLQREDLTFFDEAEGIAKLITGYGLTQAETASRLGKTQSTVANKLRLLKISSQLREFISAQKLTERHARALLKIPEQDRMWVAREIAERGMNVMAAEGYIENFLSKPRKTEAKKVWIIKDVKIFLNTINHALLIMKKAGIAAQTKKVESSAFIEYTIKIPKPMMTDPNTHL